MRIIDTIRISFVNLFRQKLRTILTIFSIVIGATLISLVYAVIPGFQNFLDLQLNTLSSPKLVELYASEERPGVQMLEMFGQGGPEEYTEEDVGADRSLFFMDSFKDEDIKNIRNIENVKEVYEFPMISVTYLKFKNEEKRLKTSLVLHIPSFMLENMDLVAGEKLTDDDKGKVILAYEYVKAFGYENPDDIVGKTIVIHANQLAAPGTAPVLSAVSDVNLPQQEVEVKTKDFELEVVGVTEKTILATIVFITLEDSIEIEKFVRGTDEVLTDKDDRRFFAYAEIENEENAEEVKKQVQNLGFSATTSEDGKNVMNDIFGVLTIVFSAFGIIAMAVSSLGILNTLVMAVYERTREIGVMKAVGATKRNIAVLFTIEAALIGLFGGLIGLGLGFGLAELLNIWGHNTVLSSFETLDLSNVSSLLLIGPVLSTVVSTLAGIYPAIRASGLDPVEAIRYE